MIEEFPKHSYCCILEKANELGLKKVYIYNWKKEEDEILYKYFPTEGRNVYKRFDNDKISPGMCTRRAAALDIKSETNATGKTFSEEEIEIMKKYYPLEGDDVYKRLKGRKKNNVISKMNKLGIRKSNNRQWDESEKDIIKKNYESEGVDIVKRLPNRTKEQIKVMACRLGVKYNIKTSTGIKYIYQQDNSYVVIVKGKYIGSFKTLEEVKEVVK